MKNILVVAAHPDDEILGLGGTLKRYSEQGVTINAIILGEGMTSRGTSRTPEMIESVKQLKEDARIAAKTIGIQAVRLCDFPDNRFDQVDLLDIIKVVEEAIDYFKPDTIFTHHFSDLNIDHQKTHNAVLTATRPIKGSGVKKIIAYETPSSTEWNFGTQAPFIPNLFVDITDTLKYKIEAMKAYKTEVKEYPHPRSLEALETIAKRWGTVVGVNYAEAFQIVRWLEL